VSRDLLFEIATEELPSSHLYGAIEQLRVAAPKLLDDARLGYDEIAVTGSPRRLVVRVTSLAEDQSARTLRHKGPAAKAAFDEAGAPTKAALGFARGKNVSVDALEVIEEGGNAYVFAIVEEACSSAAEVLSALLERLIESIEWPKSMRWGSGDTRFSRPVRGLTALFGADVVPVAFAGLTAGRTIRGHRFLSPEPIDVPSAEQYPVAAERGKVVFDLDERARLLREGIESAAAAAGGRAVVPDATFAEVVNLVEWPTVAAGTFDEGFLQVPREILENAMESHQRYFPVEDAEGHLTNRFVVAHNGDPARTHAIIAGHERVIRARLADAAFFYHEDLNRPLEAYVARLDGIVFQTRLGTLAAKSERVERLAGVIADFLGAGADERAHATRAAHLAKADLVTGAVVEFTDLQGVMGGYYALSSGEGPEVAEAIVDHYKPRFAGDDLPRSMAGVAVSIADKLDTIVGIFGIGKAPTGSSDPYALRRGAIGVLQMMLAGSRFSLDEALSAALAGYEGIEGIDPEATGAAVKEFMVARLDGLLRDRGHAYDTVAAVLAVAADDPADALARAEALTALRAAGDDMEDLSVAFTRAKNLAQPELGIAVDRALMGAEEVALVEALDAAEGRVGAFLDQEAYAPALEVLASLRAPIDAFFETVLVMDEDSALRENRLRLLNRFVALFARFADLSRLEG